MNETYPAPEHGWTCFHCGEAFKKYGAARDHFGERPGQGLACKIKAGEERGLVMALRKTQADKAVLAEALRTIIDSAEPYVAFGTSPLDPPEIDHYDLPELAIASAKAALSPGVGDRVPVKDLIEFTTWAIREGAWEGLDLDGGDIQEKAAALNLVTQVPFDPEKHGEGDGAERGDPWYVLSEALARFQSGEGR